MKEMRQDNSQGHTTGGATPSEGPPTGVGTGKNREVQPVRKQKMGRCTIQLVRVPEKEQSPVMDPTERLWWVTPATEVVVKELMIGEDVTSQQCADYGFRGTEKRVRIHCLQHFCKYVCQCGLIKTSRDAVYDHQVSKGKSDEHGGPGRRVYCVDEATYAEFCEDMTWDNPPAFKEAKQTRTGRQKQIEAASTSSSKQHISSRLGKQHRRPVLNLR